MFERRRTSIRPVTFRAVTTPKPAAPAWMVRDDEVVTKAAFPRAGASADPASTASSSHASGSEAPPESGEHLTPAALEAVSPEPVAAEAAPVVEARPVSIAPPPRIASIPPPRLASIPPAAPAGPPPALLEALQALTSARDEAFARTTDEMISLAVDLARVLVDAELESRPELHHTLVRAALDVLGEGASPRIRVAPDAFDAMVASLGGRTFEWHGRRLELEVDHSLTGPGAVLELGDGRVDAMLDSRLASVRAALVRAQGSGREAA